MLNREEKHWLHIAEVNVKGVVVWFETDYKFERYSLKIFLNYSEYSDMNFITWLELENFCRGFLDGINALATEIKERVFPYE